MPYTVGGFNPFEKYYSSQIGSWDRGEHQTCLKFHHLVYEPGSKLVVLGMVIPPLIGILIMGI